MTTTEFQFDNTFANEMDGFYVAQQAECSSNPSFVLYNKQLGERLQLDEAFLTSEKGLSILAGNQTADGSQPLSQAYAGHQFGGFSPSLGDGRAILLGELVDRDGNRFDLQLKGSGRTPFSRNGDGKAALGPVLREYLFSEAMHALGISTTRSLAAIKTGDFVIRERALPGAILARVASSHIRVGTFQFFAARGDREKIRQLADYSIARHFPGIKEGKDKYLQFLDEVIERQISLVASWMGIGFIHGVMNTDNMTISGETIDYGPCAFMDIYSPDTVFSSIDDHGRYAYKMQPVILQWNLARLAESLLEIILPDNREEAVRLATQRIEAIPEAYKEAWLKVMRMKLGLSNSVDTDEDLIERFHELMRKGKADFTQAFRMLSLCCDEDHKKFLSLFDSEEGLSNWLVDWRNRVKGCHPTAQQSQEAMNGVNPAYVPRNHLVEAALKTAVDGDEMGSFNELLHVVTHPFDEEPGLETYAVGASADAPPHVTYCGT